MGFFKNLFSKKEKEELKPVSVRKIGSLIGKQPKKKYKAEFALVYNGKPVGRIAVTEEGYSRDKVAKALSEGMAVKLTSVVQDKPRRDQE